MNLRVTSQVQTGNATAYIRTRNADFAKYQDQISSGLRVKQASDAPSSFAARSQAKSASARFASYSQTVGDTTSVLNSSVSALQDVNGVLVRARQIALEGADSTLSSDPTSREALAIEVDGLIERALAAVNARPDGKTLFSGTATDTPPFRVATTNASGRPATVVYDGAAERARTLTGQGQTTDTRYVGSDVFQQPGADVFASLIALRDDLRNTAVTGAAHSAAINQRLTEVDAARGAIGEATGEQASNLVTLTALEEHIASVKVDSAARVGDLEGTDYADAVVRLQEQEVALQAIYSVTARMFQTGLLNFIG